MYGIHEGSARGDPIHYSAKKAENTTLEAKIQYSRPKHFFEGYKKGQQ
jgi:hypothetical protein